MSHHSLPTSQHLFPMSQHLCPMSHHICPMRHHLFPMSQNLFPMSHHLFPMCHHLFPMSQHLFPMSQLLFLLSHNIFPMSIEQSHISLSHHIEGKKLEVENLVGLSLESISKAVTACLGVRSPGWLGKLEGREPAEERSLTSLYCKRYCKGVIFLLKFCFLI